MSLPHLRAVDIAERVRAGDVPATDVTAAFLARIDAREVEAQLREWDAQVDQLIRQFKK